MLSNTHQLGSHTPFCRHSKQREESSTHVQIRGRDLQAQTRSAPASSYAWPMARCSWPTPMIRDTPGSRLCISIHGWPDPNGASVAVQDAPLAQDARGQAVHHLQLQSVCVCVCVCVRGCVCVCVRGYVCARVQGRRKIDYKSTAARAARRRCAEQGLDALSLACRSRCSMAASHAGQHWGCVAHRRQAHLRHLSHLLAPASTTLGTLPKHHPVQAAAGPPTCAATSLRYLSGTFARPVPASTMNCLPSAHGSAAGSVAVGQTQ